MFTTPIQVFTMADRRVHDRPIYAFTITDLGVHDGPTHASPAHRHLIFDNDAIFSLEVARSIRRFGIHPKRTALHSPWQNGTAERFVGSVRRELLDHVVVLGENHLRRMLREYVDYYNTERVHTSIGDAPEGRAVQTRLSDPAKVIGLPRVGGLHHRYVWTHAA